MGMQNGAATMENSMEVPKKSKLEQPYNLAISLLGIYPKNLRIRISKRYLYFHA